MERIEKSKKQPEEEAEAVQKPGFALIGNLQVGKTALFSTLTTGEITSLQLPRNMTEIPAARVKGMTGDLLDPPGVFSIFSVNEDERASRNILLPHMIEHDMQGLILVADAKNIKRSLALVLQYAEYGLPMVLAVNMIDEAPLFGVEIDYQQLENILGIDVRPVIANQGIGVSKLASSLAKMKVPKKLIEYPDWVEQYLEMVGKLLKDAAISPRILGILLLAHDTWAEGYVENRYGSGMLSRLRALTDEYLKDKSQAVSILLTNIYNNKADQLSKMVQQETPPSKSPFIMKVGDWCTQPSTGIPIALAVLYFIYLFVGAFGATFVVDWINGTIFQGFLIPWTTRLIAPIPSEFIRDMIVDPDFGVIPTGLFLALGLVLPVLFCFYLAFELLENSGYLSRLSMLLDRILQKMGLNGKGVIPLILGFSCITMAILTTRMLDSRKERNIATFLLFLGIPCAPLLGVMFIILGRMPLSAPIAVFGILFLQIFVSGMLLNKILPGERTPLLMVISPLRLPKVTQVIKMAVKKTYFFMKEAVPIFILASLGVFLFERWGGLAVLERLASPLVSGYMGLPEKSVQVFIKTIIRREAGATEIAHLSAVYDNVQMVVNLLVMTFLTPCLNAVIVLVKERGLKTAVTLLALVMTYAIFIGGVLNHGFRFLGITFS